MRLAFVGKGGAGKSVIAGTLARLLAASGEPVLAVDSDPLPGLAWSTGMPATDAGIPDEAVELEPQEDGGPDRHRLRAGLSAEEAVRRYCPQGPDGLRFLQFGKVGAAGAGAVGVGTAGAGAAGVGAAGVGGGRDLAALRGSQAAFRQILAELDDSGWHLVGDLPGGTRQPFFGWAGYARTIVVVAEPTAKSVLSARRLARLSRMAQSPRVVAVVNNARQPADGRDVARRTGLDVLAAVPHDPAVAEADRLGRAPIDHAPDSPAVRAVASLLQRLIAETAEEERP